MTAAVPEVEGRDAELVGIARILQDDGYRFTTVSPATHARVNARPGNAWARTVEDVFGWSRPFRAGVLPDDLLRRMRDADVVRPHEDGWRATIRASTLDDALFLHSAFPTTDADAVFFGPDTYRYAAAIENHLADGRPVRRAVDIGSGAGPGAILVARARPSADVFAVDINDRALRFSRMNAALAGTSRVTVRRSDLLSEVDGDFDLIVANPPYLLDRDERTYRHGGGSLGEGLSLAIVDVGCARLAPGGALLLYTGIAICNGVDAFREQIVARLAGSGLDWRYRETDPDVFGEELLEPAYRDADRIAVVVLTITRPSSV
jgi:methylase of polypeptide subunit release factors